MSSRRHFLASSAIAVGTGLLPGAKAAEAKTTGGFADAVLAAFRRHRLVAVGEVHGLQEHHDALAMLLHDPRLADSVNDVVVEFGNALYQPLMDRFAAGAAVAGAELAKLWRDTTQSPLGTWDAPVYERFFRTIRAVNQPLSRNRRVRVLLGDPPIDWATITTREQLSGYLLQRATHAASLIEREVLAKGRRALICYGASHVLRTSPMLRGLSERPYVIATLAPLAGDPGGLFARLGGQPGSAPASPPGSPPDAPGSPAHAAGTARPTGYALRTVIPTAGTWLGDFDAGNVLPAPMRGPSGQPINGTCGTPLASLIDAGLYLGQAGDLTMSREDPAIYLDPLYWAELLRRNDIQGGMVNLERYREAQPVPYAPLVLPPPLQCP
jgi:hypothetical protein